MLGYISTFLLGHLGAGLSGHSGTLLFGNSDTVLSGHCGTLLSGRLFGDAFALHPCGLGALLPWHSGALLRRNISALLLGSSAALLLRHGPAVLGSDGVDSVDNGAGHNGATDAHRTVHSDAGGSQDRPGSQINSTSKVSSKIASNVSTNIGINANVSAAVAGDTIKLSGLSGLTILNVSNFLAKTPGNSSGIDGG